LVFFLSFFEFFRVFLSFFEFFLSFLPLRFKFPCKHNWASTCTGGMAAQALLLVPARLALRDPALLVSSLDAVSPGAFAGTVAFWLQWQPRVDGAQAVKASLLGLAALADAAGARIAEVAVPGSGAPTSAVGLSAGGAVAASARIREILDETHARRCKRRDGNGSDFDGDELDGFDDGASEEEFEFEWRFDCLFVVLGGGVFDCCYSQNPTKKNSLHTHIWNTHCGYYSLGGGHYLEDDDPSAGVLFGAGSAPTSFSDFVGSGAAELDGWSDATADNDARSDAAGSDPDLDLPDVIPRAADPLAAISLTDTLADWLARH
jgi:hypothetical protein